MYWAFGVLLRVGTCSNSGIESGHGAVCVGMGGCLIALRFVYQALYIPILRKWLSHCLHGGSRCHLFGEWAAGHQFRSCRCSVYRGFVFLVLHDEDGYGPGSAEKVYSPYRRVYIFSAFWKYGCKFLASVERLFHSVFTRLRVCHPSLLYWDQPRRPLLRSPGKSQSAWLVCHGWVCLYRSLFAIARKKRKAGLELDKSLFIFFQRDAANRF